MDFILMIQDYSIDTAKRGCYLEFIKRTACILMCHREINRNGFIVQIEPPQLYVDNKSHGRSGHMTHAMPEFSPASFIDFNSNCSILYWNRHSPYGWVEYRISKDAGKTYSDIKKLPYSVASFLNSLRAAN